MRQQAGIGDVAKLCGVLEAGEYGVLLSLGGFSSAAEKLASKRQQTRLLGVEWLCQMVVEHHGQLSEEHQRLLPLAEMEGLTAEGVES